jgi:hypothetical protein
MPNNLNRQLKAIRSHERRGRDLESMTPKLTTVSTRIKINATGESVAAFEFPVKFINPPAISFGFESNSEANPGRAPIFSGQVIKYNTVDRFPLSRLYVGADVLIICESALGISFVAVATAQGIALGGAA